MDLFTLFKGAKIINLEKTYFEQKSCFEKLFKIQNEVINCTNKFIRINAMECEYISPTCMIILSSVGLIAKEKSKDIKIIFKKDTKFHKFLVEKGFIELPGNNGCDKNYIPLNTLTKEEEIIPIISDLIKLSPLNKLNEKDKDYIKSRLYEIPINSLNHSMSSSGILYCGYYRKKSEFYFSIYDNGIGIPNSVRNYKNDNTISSYEALKWALESGNSTKQNEFARGIGFSLLEEFRVLYKGKITIISEDVIYESTTKGTTIKNLINKVPGTLFTFKIMI